MSNDPYGDKLQADVDNAGHKLEEAKAAFSAALQAVRDWDKLKLQAALKQAEGK